MRTVAFFVLLSCIPVLIACGRDDRGGESDASIKGTLLPPGEPCRMGEESAARFCASNPEYGCKYCVEVSSASGGGECVYACTDSSQCPAGQDCVSASGSKDAQGCIDIGPAFPGYCQ